MSSPETQVPPHHHKLERAASDVSLDPEKAAPPDAEDEKPVEAATEAEAEDPREVKPPQQQGPPAGGPPGGPPPNGGFKAWLQVLGSWFLFFNTWVSLRAFEDLK
jgi:hypothetical protein